MVISPDGYALTNFHVAFPCNGFMKCGMPDGRVYDAVIVGIDPTGDVAMIKLFGRDDFPVAEMADSDQAQVGDPVFAMGNPFLLATDFRPTVTYGILSGVHRYQFPAGTLLEYTDCLQTDASINPGNSGGPLFDARGRLLGINGRISIEKRGRVNVGVGYAISINQIKHFLGHLRSGRIVDHATLGATVAFDEDRRVIVSDILDHSDAYRRGLRYGDEIVRFAGRTIESPNALKNVLGIYPKGWRIPLTYRHDGTAPRRARPPARAARGGRASGGAARGGQSPTPMPKPKPPRGEKPEKPSSKPKPDEDIPSPVPRPDEGGPANPLQPKPVMPEIVKQHFEERRGYANYYFNRLNRDRVWKAWTARGDFASLDKLWVITGPVDGGQFRFELGRRSGQAGPAQAGLELDRHRRVGLVAHPSQQRRAVRRAAPLAAAGRRGARTLRRSLLPGDRALPRLAGAARRAGRAPRRRGMPLLLRSEDRAVGRPGDVSRRPRRPVRGLLLRV